MNRRDRYGDELEIEVDRERPDGEHLCIDGWLSVDEDGRPKPCPHCRPHLTRRTDTPAGGYRLQRTQITAPRPRSGQPRKARP